MSFEIPLIFKTDLAGLTLRLSECCIWTQVEDEPKIALLKEGDKLAMVTQFMMELQGLKTIDGEDPSRILHFNPSGQVLEYDEINSFTCDIPRGISTLSNLQRLLVYQNMFSGEIPEIFANLTRLSEIAMENNQFSENIPAGLRGCQQLQTLDMSWNRLHGSIQVEIFKLSNLNNLILVNNMLSGSIPSEVDNLKQLQFAAAWVKTAAGKVYSASFILTQEEKEQLLS
ncbi:hypothetical protein GQ457_07G030250 [Hibiscus cannabinus]